MTVPGASREDRARRATGAPTPPVPFALAIDADTRSRSRAASVLKAAGFEVAESAGLPGSRGDSERRPALVVLRAPLAGALGLCRELRARYDARTVILGLARRRSSAGDALLEAGADDCLASVDDASLRAWIQVAQLRAGAPAPLVAPTVASLLKAVEALPLGVTITDALGRILYANEAEARMHGYSAAQLIGRYARTLSPRADWKPLPPTELGGLGQWRRQRTRYRRDGSSFPVRLLSDVVTDPAGSAVGLVTFCEDITAAQNVEASLRLSEERFHRLVQAAHDSILTFTADGRLTSVNPAFETLTGASAAECLDRPFTDLVHPGDTAPLEGLLGALGRGEAGPAAELRVRCAGGAWRTLELRGTPLVEGGRVVACLGVGRDVSERGRARDRQGLQLAAARLLADDGDLDEVVPPLLRLLGERMEWPLVLLWTVDERAERLVCLDAWRAPDYRAEAFELTSRTMTLPREEGLPGRVWSAGRALRSAAGEGAGVRPGSLAGVPACALAAPVVGSGRVLGVLELLRDGGGPADEDTLALLEDVGSQLGHFLSRKRLESALREGERRYRNLFEAALDLIVTLSVGGVITALNPAFEAMTGLRREDWVGRPLADLVDPADAAEAASVIERLVRGEASARGELRLATARGDRRLLEYAAVPQVRDGWVVGALAIGRDVTERRQAEEALRTSEERYALAVRGTNDGIWDWDLLADRAYFSPRWKAMLGYADDELADNTEEWFSRVHPDDRERLQSRLSAYLAGRAESFGDEHRLRHRDGSYRWMLNRAFVVRDPEGRPRRMVGAQTDVTDRRAHDPLTGLPNRALFLEHLDHALARLRRRGSQHFAVLYLDLDHFKSVNDTLGHAAGDQLLIAFAQRLESCLRPGDVVARLGGDEFAVLLERILSLGEATDVASRIQRELEAPLLIRGRAVPCSASLGVALATARHASPEELLAESDRAMYRAKQLGKHRFEVFDEAMRRQADDLAALEKDLGGALQRGELRVHLQPMVALRGQQVLGQEVLLRWQHPQRGLLAAADFLTMAEETRTIVPAGYWVLAEACRQAALLPSGQIVTLNLGRSQLRDATLPRRVLDALSAAGLPPRRLLVEVPEALLLHADEAMRATLAALRGLGVGLVIDRFRAGTLSLLHDYGAEAVKLDPVLVAAVAEDAGTRLFVQGLLTATFRLGVRAIACGVETEAQRAALRRLRCPAGQGLLLGAPAEGPLTPR